ncbi:CpcT/CpeT family chromophore lyase [Candidatus Cyanaurora vandensis]|uniref:CpcT/CpeT family chromophore lyase n=1 Tax=Candidatus Cyanaurora vandensis TaxID=2714958 RepID=UPI00257F41D9|nr:CpcT/CpeT family chromophore lyase [Candidatus Cyanaurora vandensis]
MDTEAFTTAKQLAHYLAGSFSNEEQFKQFDGQDTQRNSLNSVSDVHALVRLDILPAPALHNLSPLVFYFRQEIHINQIHMKRLRVLELVALSPQATKLRMHLLPQAQSDLLLIQPLLTLQQQVVSAADLTTDDCCNVTYYWNPETDIFAGELPPRQCSTCLNGSAYITVHEQIGQGQIEIAERFYDSQDQQVFGVKSVPYIYRHL